MKPPSRYLNWGWQSNSGTHQNRPSEDPIASTGHGPEDAGADEGDTKYDAAKLFSKSRLPYKWCTGYTKAPPPDRERVGYIAVHTYLSYAPVKPFILIACSCRVLLNIVLLKYTSVKETILMYVSVNLGELYSRTQCYSYRHMFTHTCKHYIGSALEMKRVKACACDVCTYTRTRMREKMSRKSWQLYIDKWTIVHLSRTCYDMTWCMLAAFILNFTASSVRNTYKAHVNLL